MEIGFTEGTFQMGTVTYKLLLRCWRETEGALQLGPERARVLQTFFAEEKERYKDDFRSTNILFKVSIILKSTIQLVETVKWTQKHFSRNNLIESLTNTLALLNQSFKEHLPQINNQLRTSTNARNKATVQDDRVVVQDVRDRYNVNNQGRPFQRNKCKMELLLSWNVGGQTELEHESWSS
ncbi:hypothetical protein Tco_1503215 [Tanacetum coccineum]